MTTKRNVQHSQPQEPEPGGEEIVVVGVREKPSFYAEDRIALNLSGFSMYRGPTADATEFLPASLRALLSIDTRITISDEFSQHHFNLVKLTIAKLFSLPQFKGKFDELLQKFVDLDIHPATRSDQIQDNDGGILGRSSNGTVPDGAKLDIYIAMIIHSAPVSDISFLETLIHELIHALGVPAWDVKLHDESHEWDREVRQAAFAGYDFFAGTSGTPISQSTPIESTGPGGGLLAGTIDGSVLVGSTLDDDIRALTGNIIFPARVTIACSCPR